MQLHVVTAKILLQHKIESQKRHPVFNSHIPQRCIVDNSVPNPVLRAGLKKQRKRIVRSLHCSRRCTEKTDNSNAVWSVLGEKSHQCNTSSVLPTSPQLVLLQILLTLSGLGEFRVRHLAVPSNCIVKPFRSATTHEYQIFHHLQFFLNNSNSLTISKECNRI